MIKIIKDHVRFSFILQTVVNMQSILFNDTDFIVVFQTKTIYLKIKYEFLANLNSLCENRPNKNGIMLRITPRLYQQAQNIMATQTSYICLALTKNNYETKAKA